MEKSIKVFIFIIISMTSIMAQKEIKTSIIIKATPEKVWSILQDFESYPQWNPLVTKAEGDFLEGNRIKITAGGMNFKPVVLVNHEFEEMRWLGSLLFKGLFDGEHSFHIVNNNDGTVTFKHEEMFTGLLVGLFAKKLDKDTLPGFLAMNKKLKELAEQ